jgi:hypothetical protein
MEATVRTAVEHLTGKPPDRLTFTEVRTKALYEIDGGKQLRRSHENPSLKILYDEFLGKIGGHKAHELLHTAYSARRPQGV